MSKREWEDYILEELTKTPEYKKLIRDLANS